MQRGNLRAGARCCERGYKRLEDVAGHDQGRALRVCYVRFVEAAVMYSLGASSCLSNVRRRAAHA